MTLHEVVLTVHSTLRWIVLVSGAVVFVRAVGAARTKRPWNDADTKLVRGFVRAVDVQVTLGLFMYFATSALGVRMLAHAREAMKTSTLRFFAVEHIFGMIAASAVLHVGLARVRRRADERDQDPPRHRSTAIVIGVVLLIVLATIPWPIFPYGRPLLRGM